MGKTNESVEKIPLKIGDDISYLYYFYKYLFKEQTKSVIVLGLINFVLGLLPILLVIFFEIWGMEKAKQLQFYGDGSMIIFCFGVLVSFVTFNTSSLFGGVSESISNNIINNKKIFYVITFIYYFISYKVFEKAQTNFSRTLEFIYWVNGVSILFLIIAFLIVIFMTFSEKYNYSIIQPYREALKAESKAKKAAKKNKSTNTNVDL